VITFSGHAVLLDIEGTTSSISFVYDVMFPFARRELDNYLRDQWGSSALIQVIERLAQDVGFDSMDAWIQASAGEIPAMQLVRDAVIGLMDGDIKATGLKQLQGLIWQQGFETGEMRAHIYEDVLPALNGWTQAGLDIRIFSSGSVHAQKLFFRHTIEGDLLSRFSGHYDTTTGPKRQPESYSKIAAEFELPTSEILFLSDVPAELDAAMQVGMQTGWCVRPGNPPLDSPTVHPAIQKFSEIELRYKHRGGQPARWP
jgi:enolase-phosphatase E1